MRRPLVGRSLLELQRDYATALRLAEELGAEEEALATLRAHADFFIRESHRVGPFPSALHSLLHAQPLDSRVRVQTLALEKQGKPLRRSWLRLLNPPPTNPNPELLFTQHAGQGGI